ncbi:uncharacterized protein LOC143579637 [Bidens hawaiensis]|uniref:uncharacterized protein LOC143579637 n=1 Tax=Bidens hawaiensis TaxID=980011 RepID=UPI00404ACAAD
MVKSVKLSVRKILKLALVKIQAAYPFFSTDKIFVSHDELKKWAEKTSRANGVVIVTERTKKNAKGEVNKIFLMCDRGGVYKSTVKVKRSGVFEYVNTKWLVKYKEMFVFAWSDQVLHFGNSITSRVESTHTLLKNYLLTTKSTLEKSAGVIDQIVKSQHKAIKGTFEESHNKLMNGHNIPLFKELRGKVSKLTLGLLVKELERMNKLIEYEYGCGCHLCTSCSLPCACMLSNYLTAYETIPLDSIDIFYKKLDFNPLYAEHEKDISCASVVEAFTQEFEKHSDDGKRNMLPKFWSFIKPTSSIVQVPEVQKNTRGGPKIKDSVKKKKKHEPSLNRSNSTMLTLRDDFDEFLPVQLEPSKESSFVGSHEGIRHSLFVGSHEGIRQSSVTRSHDKVHYFHQYLDRVHPIVCPFVTHIQDVAPDGNCGYRAMVVALNYDEDNWRWVRSELLDELKAN